MAVGPVGTFNYGAFLGREAADTFVFFAELGVASMADRAYFVFFAR